MKRSELTFAFILVPLDAIALIAAFVLAYFTRVQSNIIYIWDFNDYFRFIFTLLPFWLLIFAFSGLYRISSIKRSGLDDLKSIFLSVSSGIMLVVAYLFLSRTEFFSRLIVLYAWVYAIIFILLIRTIIRLTRRSLLRHGIGIYRTIIVGEGSSARNLINALNADPRLGFKVVKIINKEGLDKILTIIKHSPADEIILADNSINDKEVANLIESTYGIPINIKLVPNVYRLQESNAKVDTIADIPLLIFNKTPLDGWGTIYKRIIDIIGSIFGLVLFSPIFLIITLLIKLTDRGPVIYKNIRVGHEGNFITYKFRSMYIQYCTGDEYGGKQALKLENEIIKEKNIKPGSAVYKIANDPRITLIGKIIRKTSLDELPQFYNVLIGSMSLVGPRPHQPREVANYTPQQRKLLVVKPGITGMAQISGRSDLSFDEEANLDIYYVENWSIWLDIKVIIRTFFAIFKKSGAY